MKRWINDRLFVLLILVFIPGLFISFSTGETGYKTSLNTDFSSHDDIPDEVDLGASMDPSVDFIIVPLKNAGRLLLIDAIIDNVQGNLVFDTGASGLVLNKTYFRKYISTSGQDSRGITGNVHDAEKVTAGTMNVSGLKYKGIPATVSDLSHIENRRGIKVIGLFGFELIREFEVVIDAVNGQLMLYRIDKQGNRVNGSRDNYSGITDLAFSEKMNILFLSGVISGKQLKFCLDTGAETNALDNSLSKTILQTVTIERRSNLSGAGAARTEVLYGTMNDFALGSAKIRNMKTIITNLDALSEAYGVGLDGMLGYDFITRGTICINFVKRQFDMQFNKQ
ncbi:MAG: pepsin/retropepsin-like aspartic protease family protein [Bacteroidales bacterium]